MSKYASGVICALAGAILWGFSGSCAQLLTQGYGISSFLLVLMRMPVSAAVFIVIVLATPRRKVAVEMLRDRGTRRGLLVFGVFGLFACQLTYIVAIACTNAGTGTVLEQFSIVIIMVLACILARKLPNALEVAGLVCAFAAVLLVSTKGDLSTLAIGADGLAWGLGAAVATTIYVSYPKRLFDRWGSFMVTALGTLTGACLCIALILVCAAWGLATPGGTNWLQETLAFPPLDLMGWIALGVVTLVGTFLAFILYLRGVHAVGTVRGSQLGAAEPAAAAVVSALWLGTPFTWADWLGLALMIATIFLVSRGEGRKPQKKAQAKPQKAVTRPHCKTTNGGENT